jgi:hypothetical protein
MLVAIISCALPARQAMRVDPTTALHYEGGTTMKTVRSFFHRLRNLFRKEELDRGLSDELSSHLEMQVADNRRAGMSEQQARRDTPLKLGGVEQTKQSHRERCGLPLLETLWQDLRFGLRMSRKNPGFTNVTVPTLALGIGANTAIFAAVNGILLHTAGIPHADRVMAVCVRYQALNIRVPKVAE